MDFSKIKDLYIGGAPVQYAYLNGHKIWQRVNVQSILDSMVLWYDIARQGCTNESMAGNPVLRDLSGNGHDATCYNFGWTEESGISTVNYPNALVSDGVDDYAMVTGVPSLTVERGYTVIAKRQILNESGCTADNRTEIGDSVGAFVFELLSLNRTDSFGETNTISGNDIPQTFSFQTSLSYNGKQINRGGAGQDSDTIHLFKFKSENGDYYGNIALYSFLLFDRDLTEQEIEWVKTNIVEEKEHNEQWYGIEYYTTSSNPDCIRIGNPELHRTLPVHSMMKGCLLNDDGSVNKYLNESDWTSETRDGSQGQVMVEMPQNAYWKFETEGNIRRVKFSTEPLEGFKKITPMYISAYEATVQRSVNRLSSVVNTDVDYRGGNNNADWDETSKSLLGKPASSISRTNFRNYARNRKAGSNEWNCMFYEAQKLLYWLYVVEFATLNSQKAFNAQKDSNGYAQGGLGNGVTTLKSSDWYSYNRYNPLIPCGYTDSLGNSTGEVYFSMPEDYGNGTVTVKVSRYRGIENAFGHLWQLTDGVNVRISPTEGNGSDGLSKVYVTTDPAYFNDSNYDNMIYVGDEARSQNYVTSVIFGEGGEIIPDAVGGNYYTYFCDYHYTSIPTSSESLRVLSFGGRATDGMGAGLVYADSSNVPSSAGATVGSRLCFIPE